MSKIALGDDGWQPRKFIVNEARGLFIKIIGEIAPEVITALERLLPLYKSTKERCIADGQEEKLLRLLANNGLYPFVFPQQAQGLIEAIDNWQQRCGLKCDLRRNDWIRDWALARLSYLNGDPEAYRHANVLGYLPNDDRPRKVKRLKERGYLEPAVPTKTIHFELQYSKIDFESFDLFADAQRKYFEAELLDYQKTLEYWAKENGLVEKNQVTKVHLEWLVFWNICRYNTTQIADQYDNLKKKKNRGRNVNNTIQSGMKRAAEFIDLPLREGGKGRPSRSKK